LLKGKRSLSYLAAIQLQQWRWSQAASRDHFALIRKSIYGGTKAEQRFSRVTFSIVCVGGGKGCAGISCEITLFANAADNVGLIISFAPPFIVAPTHTLAADERATVNLHQNTHTDFVGFLGLCLFVFC